MSSIKFDASISTEKLDEGLKKANQSFAEFEKNAVKSGETVDKSFQKSTQNLKEQVAQQKQLIKEIEQDIKNMRKERDEMTRMEDKSNANKNINAANAALAQEQNRLLDLQKKQIESNQKESESHGGLFQSLGKWAIGLASVHTAMKIGKEIIESTTASSHAFEFAVQAAESGLGFFFKTIATGDWSNFTDNMQKAISTGYEYAKMMHEVKESTWALQLKESSKLKENAQLEIDLRNKMLTPEENVAAGMKRIENEEKLAEERVKVAKKTVEAAELIAVERSKIDAKTLQGIIRMTDEETRVKAEAYNKQLKLAQTKGGNLLVTPGAIEAAKLAVEKAPAEVKLYADALRGYGGLKEEMIIGYKDALVALDKADASALTGTKRLRGMLSARQVEIKKDAEDAIKKAKEDAELENRIKATQEAMKTASGEELNQLAAKYVALEKELKLRKDIVNQALMLAGDESSALLPLNMNMNALTMRTGGKVTAGMTGTTTAAQATNIAHFKEVENVVKSTDKQIKQNVKDAKELTKEQIDAEKEMKRRKIETLNAMMTITYEMGKQLGLSEQLMTLMDETFNAISKAASGDMIGASFSAMMAITDGLIALSGDFGASKRAEGIQKVNDLLTEQNRIVQEAVRKGDEVNKRNEELRLLKEKQIQLTKNQESAENTLNNPTILTRMINLIGAAGLIARIKQKKKLLEEISATQTEIDAVNEQIRQAEQAIDDLKVGGITETTLADAIAQGFQAGKTSVDDFAEYMNTVLLDAVMNIFKGDILADMQPLLEKVRQSLGDKKLTKEEKDAITLEAKRVADENQNLFKDLTSSLSLGDASIAQRTGLSGQIQRSITEETGTELAGLFRRNADDTRGIRDYTKAGLSHLMAIEANTGETVLQLKKAVTELQAIVTNTKPAYTGKI